MNQLNIVDKRQESDSSFAIEYNDIDDLKSQLIARGINNIATFGQSVCYDPMYASDHLSGPRSLKSLSSADLHEMVQSIGEKETEFGRSWTQLAAVNNDSQCDQ